MDYILGIMPNEQSCKRHKKYLYEFCARANGIFDPVLERGGSGVVWEKIPLYFIPYSVSDQHTLQSKKNIYIHN